MQIRFIWIERLPDGLSRFVFEMTGHAVESNSYKSDPDRKRFRYLDVNTTIEWFVHAPYHQGTKQASER